jgi:hypothetical protein
LSIPVETRADSLAQSEADWVKVAAAEEKKTLDEIRTNLWAEHSHLFRWLTGSLLAINGGSAVAVLGSEQIDGIAKLIAGGLFSSGILAALLVGVFGQRANQIALPKIQELAGYWIAVSIDGQRDEEIEANLIGAINKPTWQALASRGAGWLSALLFAGGVVSIGLAVSHQEKGNVESSGEHRSASADERFH